MRNGNMLEEETTYAADEATDEVVVRALRDYGRAFKRIMGEAYEWWFG